MVGRATTSDPQNTHQPTTLTTLSINISISINGKDFGQGVQTGLPASLPDAPDAEPAPIAPAFAHGVAPLPVKPWRAAVQSGLIWAMP